MIHSNKPIYDSTGFATGAVHVDKSAPYTGSSTGNTHTLGGPGTSSSGSRPFDSHYPNYNGNSGITVGNSGTVGSGGSSSSTTSSDGSTFAEKSKYPSVTTQPIKSDTYVKTKPSTGNDSPITYVHIQGANSYKPSPGFPTTSSTGSIDTTKGQTPSISGSTTFGSSESDSGSTSKITPSFGTSPVGSTETVVGNAHAIKPTNVGQTTGGLTGTGFGTSCLGSANCGSGSVPSGSISSGNYPQGTSGSHGGSGGTSTGFGVSSGTYKPVTPIKPSYGGSQAGASTSAGAAGQGGQTIGTFPGSPGSILTSKPAPGIIPVGISSGPTPGSSGYGGSHYTGPFPGPVGSIHQSKPASAGSTSVGSASASGPSFGNVGLGSPISHPSASSNANSGSHYSGPFPGPSGSINVGKPVLPSTELLPSKPGGSIAGAGSSGSSSAGSLGQGSTTSGSNYKGPFPGPSGSIHQSKPVSFIPVLHNVPSIISGNSIITNGAPAPSGSVYTKPSSTDSGKYTAFGAGGSSGRTGTSVDCPTSNCQLIPGIGTFPTIGSQVKGGGNAGGLDCGQGKSCKYVSVANGGSIGGSTGFSGGNYPGNGGSLSGGSLDGFAQGNAGKLGCALGQHCDNSGAGTGFSTHTGSSVSNPYPQGTDSLVFGSSGSSGIPGCGQGELCGAGGTKPAGVASGGSSSGTYTGLQPGGFGSVVGGGGGSYSHSKSSSYSSANSGASSGSYSSSSSSSGSFGSPFSKFTESGSRSSAYSKSKFSTNDTSECYA